MTPGDLKALLEGATPRPWKRSERGIYEISIQSPDSSVAEWDDIPISEEDADLTCAAVNALPQLLALWEAAEAAYPSVGWQTPEWQRFGLALAALKAMP